MSHPHTVRQLLPADLSTAKRLHRFTKAGGRPVFGEDFQGVEEMLTYAASGLSGAFGFVAVTSTASEDIVGVLTAQWDEDVELPRAGSSNPPGDQPADPISVILLTLVVRPDCRSSGLGRQLMSALLAAADLHRMSAACDVLTDVAIDNEPALHFFQQTGFIRQPPAAQDSASVEMRLQMGPFSIPPPTSTDTQALAPAPAAASFPLTPGCACAGPARSRPLLHHPPAAKHPAYGSSRVNLQPLAPCSPCLISQAGLCRRSVPAAFARAHAVACILTQRASGHHSALSRLR